MPRVNFSMNIIWLTLTYNVMYVSLMSDGGGDDDDEMVILF